jgi:large subunit ribosomal protein L15
MQLNNIKLNHTKKNKKRVGRGIGSGKGKTCGRGHKGQKSRSGVAIKSFEGGQMPLYRRLPKRGFKSFKNKDTVMINLKNLQILVDKKVNLPENKITLSSLIKSKSIKKKYKKIRLISSGNLKSKIDVEVNFISKSAKEKIEKLGGKVSLIK